MCTARDSEAAQSGARLTRPARVPAPQRAVLYSAADASPTTSPPAASSSAEAAVGLPSRPPIDRSQRGLVRRSTSLKEHSSGEEAVQPVSPTRRRTIRDSIGQRTSRTRRSSWATELPTPGSAADEMRGLLPPAFPANQSAAPASGGLDRSRYWVRSGRELMPVHSPSADSPGSASLSSPDPTSPKGLQLRVPSSVRLTRPVGGNDGAVLPADISKARGAGCLLNKLAGPIESASPRAVFSSLFAGVVLIILLYAFVVRARAGALFGAGLLPNTVPVKVSARAVHPVVPATHRFDPALLIEAPRSGSASRGGPGVPAARAGRRRVMQAGRTMPPATGTTSASRTATGQSTVRASSTPSPTQTTLRPTTTRIATAPPAVSTNPMPPPAAGAAQAASPANHSAVPSATPSRSSLPVRSITPPAAGAAQAASPAYQSTAPSATPSRSSSSVRSTTCAVSATWKLTALRTVSPTRSPTLLRLSRELGVERISAEDSDPIIPTAVPATTAILLPSRSPTAVSSPTPSPSPSPSQTAALSPTYVLTATVYVQPTAPPTPTEEPVVFHGGSVMLEPVTVYYIWYGNWKGNSAPGIMQHLADNIGGSPWYRLVDTYPSAEGLKSSYSVRFGAHFFDDKYSRGRKTLDDHDIWGIVSAPLLAEQIPIDPNAVYFVMTSPDLAHESTSGRFCTDICGWHWYEYIGDVTVKYAFIGGSARCPAICMGNQFRSPNSNAQADAMASVVAHELIEAVTDPEMDAYFDDTGEENADKCSWTWGLYYKSPTGGGFANMQLGDRHYLIQQNWYNVVNSTSSGFCASQLP